MWILGIIKQLGQVGIALSTLAIALYSFIGVWRGMVIQSNRVPGAIIGVVWFFIGLSTLLGNVLNNGTRGGFVRPALYGCYIGGPFIKWRLFGVYLWFMINFLITIITYVPLYFWSRGNITFNNVSWWGFTIHRVDPSEELEGIWRQSLTMLLYPGVYCLITLPLAVVLWIGYIQGKAVPPSAIFAASILFGLGGTCNTILLLTTRPESGLFTRANDSGTG